MSSSPFAEDLAIAAAALVGDRDSLAAIDAAIHAASASVARTMRLSSTEADEAAQIARVKLLVKVGDAEPALARYAGTGPLRAFVASVLGQEALRVAKRISAAAAKEEPAEDVLSAIILPSLPSLSEEFVVSFRQAFHAALATLDARSRTVLRLTVVDGLTADEIGAGYQTHRVTVARWLRQIRETLLAETRRRLAGELSASSGELDAMLETHLAEVDVSLSRVLREMTDE